METFRTPQIKRTIKAASTGTTPRLQSSHPKCTKRAESPPAVSNSPLNLRLLRSESLKESRLRRSSTRDQQEQRPAAGAPPLESTRSLPTARGNDGSSLLPAHQYGASTQRETTCTDMVLLTARDLQDMPRVSASPAAFLAGSGERVERIQRFANAFSWLLGPEDPYQITNKEIQVLPPATGTGWPAALRRVLWQLHESESGNRPAEENAGKENEGGKLDFDEAVSALTAIRDRMKAARALPLSDSAHLAVHLGLLRRDAMNMQAELKGLQKRLRVTRMKNRVVHALDKQLAYKLSALLVNWCSSSKSHRVMCLNDLLAQVEADVKAAEQLADSRWDDF